MANFKPQPADSDFDSKNIPTYTTHSKNHSLNFPVLDAPNNEHTCKITSEL
jgi:hypothetical protein